MSFDDATTRRAASAAGDDGRTSVPALTVLSHPDPRRIGERVLLPELGLGLALELSRVAPRFSQPGALWDDRPLDDPFVSRKPWRLSLGGKGLTLENAGSSTQLRVDGELVPDTAVYPLERLDTGLPLELADRIALLLHRTPSEALTMPARETADDGMVGASHRLLEVRQAITRVADLDVSVLLRGASGTGKELVARALHQQSQRAKGPFVAVDLGALSPSLAASELFGHTKGAFTGAAGARDGTFRAADGGTLFLDEIGEAPAEVQAMLLRVLETREVTPVGSNVRRPVDVRLVAATDADLEGQTQRGHFKEPLLHRLAGYEIWLPTLAERREDLGRLFVALARPILQEVGAVERLERPSGDHPPWIPPSLMTRLAQASWPGNIRQLGNVVRQLVIDSRGTEQLVSGPRVAALLAEAPGKAPPKDTAPSVTGNASDKTPRRPADLDPDEVEAAMRACAFEPAAAARKLGIRRPSLYNLLRQHPRLRLAEDVGEDELRTALTDCDDDVHQAALRLEVSPRALGRRLARKG